jgi:hypothetical protein
MLIGTVICSTFRPYRHSTLTRLIISQNIVIKAVNLTMLLSSSKIKKLFRTLRVGDYTEVLTGRKASHPFCPLGDCSSKGFNGCFKEESMKLTKL